eukprot:Clim_evm9s241 gene=Clim_evmTU9s241
MHDSTKEQTQPSLADIAVEDPVLIVSEAANSQDGGQNNTVVSLILGHAWQIVDNSNDDRQSVIIIAHELVRPLVEQAFEDFIGTDQMDEGIPTGEIRACLHRIKFRYYPNMAALRRYLASLYLTEDTNHLLSVCLVCSSTVDDDSTEIVVQRSELWKTYAIFVRVVGTLPRSLQAITLDLDGSIYYRALHRGRLLLLSSSSSISARTLVM